MYIIKIRINEIVNHYILRLFTFTFTFIRGQFYSRTILFEGNFIRGRRVGREKELMNLIDLI